MDTKACPVLRRHPGATWTLNYVWTQPDRHDIPIPRDVSLTVPTCSLVLADVILGLASHLLWNSAESQDHIISHPPRQDLDQGRAWCWATSRTCLPLVFQRGGKAYRRKMSISLLIYPHLANHVLLEVQPVLIYTTCVSTKARTAQLGIT